MRHKEEKFMRIFLFVLFMLSMVLSSCSSPVTPEVLSTMSVDKQEQLKVWSTNHANVFDLRIHSLNTCPFLTYMPNYMALQNDNKKLGEFLYSFYHYKHLEANCSKCGK